MRVVVPDGNDRLAAGGGRLVVVARPKGRGVVGAYVDAQIERSGLFYAYTTESTCCQIGHVVFVPWKTLQRLMD